MILQDTRQFTSFSGCSVNLFYGQLLLSHQDSQLTEEKEFRALIHSVLANYANYVENLHRDDWRVITHSMSGLSRKENFRRKMDKCLCRINTRLTSFIETQNVNGVVLQLKILGDYLVHCKSRVMPLQVADVCLENLLRIKQWATRNQYGVATNLQLLYHLLEVLDELALQNRNPQLNTFLLVVLWQRSDFQRQFQLWTHKVLLDADTENAVLALPQGNQLLTRCRQRLITHYKTCLKMLAKFSKRGETSKLVVQLDEATMPMLAMLEFLVHPSTGLLLQFMKAGEVMDYLPVKLEILSFFRRLFLFKKSPFMKKGYVETYLSFFYLSFIKIYHNNVRDKATLDLCTAYLRVVLSFALNKNNKVCMQFFQLRVMDFLTYELSLEYELQFEPEKFLKSQDHRPFFENALKPPLEQPAAPVAASGTPVIGSGRVPSLALAIPKLKLSASPSMLGANEPAAGPSPPKAPSPELLPPLALAIPKLKLSGSLFSAKKADAPDSSSTEPPTNVSTAKSKGPLIPKLKLTLDAKESSDSPPLPSPASKGDDISAKYLARRENVKLYLDQNLHTTVLLVTCTLLLSNTGTLDPTYSDQFPVANKKQNVPFLLALHVNNSNNCGIVPLLARKMVKMTDAHVCLLKLLSTNYFVPELYQNLYKLAAGAYGVVYSCDLVPTPSKGIPLVGNLLAGGFMGGDVSVNESVKLAVKLMHLENSIQDRSVLHDSFSEVLILSKFKHDPRVCHLYDFGVSSDNYWLVMKSYKASLKKWRQQQSAPLAKMLPLYLNIFSQVLTAAQFLIENNVNHYDLKCDNLLVEPHSGVSDEDFWNQPTGTPNFSVCLADFGDAKIYFTENEGYSLKTRGTEWISSPEMLSIAKSSQKTRDTYDRRKKVGANRSSDVWSLGCLLYELLTCEFLFCSPDWMTFFTRVTCPTEDLVTKECRERIDNNKHLLQFFEYVLERNPDLRPSLKDITTKFNLVKQLILIDTAAQQQQPAPQPPPAVVPPPPDCVRLVREEERPPPSPPSSLPYEPEPPSCVCPGLFVTAAATAQALGSLQIRGFTHLVNCSRDKNLFPYHFSYHAMSLTRVSRGADTLDAALDACVAYIHEARFHTGKVLVYSDAGVSHAPAVAIAYLITAFRLSYFEAFLRVRNRHPSTALEPALSEYLVWWCRHKFRQTGLPLRMPSIWPPASSEPLYSCLCGHCVIALRRSLDFDTGTTLQRNPLECTCKPGEAATCPNTGSGCAAFLGLMRQLHGYDARHVLWGFTTTSNLRTDVSHLASCTLLCVPLQEDKGHEWELHRCRICGFLTHAVSTRAHSEDDAPLVVVTNCGTATWPSIQQERKGTLQGQRVTVH
eukprot:TRINITY_DN4728_c0_g1_i4.p1 TRINITY_DN4728_c0_g1~~TRINITY_DN4728_c0_g1_i4.p1  ORF type:complete len:1345 (-),score=379.66 TRINITY_DN4728_c0_g1_i4:118-4152(-)